MSRTQRTQLATPSTPTSANAGFTFGELTGSAGEHTQYFADGFSAGYYTAREDRVARREAVRAAIMAKIAAKRAQQ